MDLSGSTLRAYGGVGLALDGPSLIVRACSGSGVEISSDLDPDPDLDAQVEGALGELGLEHVQLQIDYSIPPHVGLGSKTACLLGSLTAASLQLRNEVDVESIQLASKRGGTSGIGINSFFLGGVIADGGHERATAPPWEPSSRRSPESVPPVIARISGPAGWLLRLYLPHGRRRFGEDEADVFTRHAPLPHHEVLETLAAVYHGVLPAVALSDLSLLRESLIAIHRIGFKARELIEQSDTLRDFFEKVSRVPRVAAGMSSMGPLIYVVAARLDNQALDEVRRVAEEFGSDVTFVGDYRIRNEGYEVRSL